MLAIPVGLPGQKVGWRRAESITEGPNGTSNTEASTHINSVLMYSYAVYVINLHIYATVVAVKVTQSSPTLCDPTDCSPPASSLHGILQATVLEGVAISFSRGSS